MNGRFPHHAVGYGRPRKCVPHWPEYRRRGRNSFGQSRAELTAQLLETTRKVRH